MSRPVVANANINAGGGPDHFVNRRSPPKRCLCGCTRALQHGSSKYASHECRARHLGIGRYRDLEAQLRGRPF